MGARSLCAPEPQAAPTGRSSPKREVLAVHLGDHRRPVKAAGVMLVERQAGSKRGRRLGTLSLYLCMTGQMKLTGECTSRRSGAWTTASFQQLASQRAAG